MDGETEFPSGIGCRDRFSRTWRAGVLREQVDFVMCTHLHANHVGWNNAAATVHATSISKSEFEWRRDALESGKTHPRPQAAPMRRQLR